MSDITWMEREYVEERCRDDGHPESYWCRWYTSSGEARICVWCPRCQKTVTRETSAATGNYVSAERFTKLTGRDPSSLPEERSAERLRMCRICRTVTPCEYHHVAPQAVFGKVADLLPVVPLCHPCHVRVEQIWRDYLNAWKGAA